MRRRRAKERKILPDPKYRNQNVAKFINMLMLNGKKAVAESIVYDALDIAAEKQKDAPLEVLDVALKNVAPKLEVKSKRVGGATFQVPVPVPERRQTNLAMKWIIDAARKRSEKDMYNKLAAELLDAVNERGGAMKKREDVRRMAEANRAFAHYAQI